MVVVRSELIEQFVNTLNADYKYSRYNWDNLWQQVSRHIFRKLNSFSRIFITFLKSALNLEYFEKKDQSHSLNITKTINWETCGYLNVQKSIFHATLR